MPMPEASSLASQVTDSRDPNAIVVLRSVNRRRCAKHFVKGADGVIGVVPYDKESHWFPDVVPCPDFDTFCQALDILTSCRDRIVVRGALRDAVTAVPIMRRCVGAGATLQPVLRAWVALDVDGLDVSEPTIPAVLALLPHRFRGVACFYQFTSSYGVLRPLNEMRVRLWYRLSHPMSDAAWKRTLCAEAPNLTTAPNVILDMSLYNPVQPHYIAAPSFEGMTDPLVHRSAIYDELGLAQLVDVSDIENRDEIDEGIVVASALTRTGIDAHPDQINAILDRFATRARHTSRHATMVALMGELYGHGLSGEETMRHARRYMEQQGRPPERGEMERALSFVQRRAAAGELRTNEVPISLVFEAVDDEPATPEEAAANADANEEVAAEWPVQPNAMARRAYADLFAGEGYVRWGKCDFEWTGGYWRRMADDEELQARMQRAARCTPTAASRGADALRNERHQSHLRPPCLLIDGTPIAPRVPTLGGWLSVAEVRAGAPPVLKDHTSEVFDVLPPMPVSYDPEARCPRFDRFLDECFEGDMESRTALIRLMGYLLFKGNEYQRVFICTGAPASGKSTWLRVMRALLGPARSVVGDLRTFGTDFGLASVYEAQALFLPEASNSEEGARLDGPSVDQLKRISGGDPVLIRRKYQDDVVAEQMPTPVVICNLPPLIRDEAFIRRLVTINFPHSFLGREDSTLTSTLLLELPGILNVALRGLADIRQRRDPFPPPAEAGDHEDAEPTAAREVYEQIRADSSPVGEYARTCLRARAEGFLPVTLLFDVYRRWCAATSQRAMAEPAFTRRLRHALPNATWGRRRHGGGRGVGAGERSRGLVGIELSAEGTRLQTDTGAF